MQANNLGKITMGKVQFTFFMLMGWSAFAFAEITDVTGNLDAGPNREILSGGYVCRDALDIFRLYELRANGVSDANMNVAAKKIVSGSCKQLPPTSVWVTGIKLAKIYGKAMPQPSLYVVVRVRISGDYYYVAPHFLNDTGFEIIKQAQIQNKRNGTPLVQ